jgi:hypothetical protein
VFFISRASFVGRRSRSILEVSYRAVFYASNKKAALKGAAIVIAWEISGEPIRLAYGLLRAIFAMRGFRGFGLAVSGAYRRHGQALTRHFPRILPLVLGTEMLAVAADWHIRQRGGLVSVETAETDRPNLQDSR